MLLFSLSLWQSLGSSTWSAAKWTLCPFATATTKTVKQKEKIVFISWQMKRVRVAFRTALIDFITGHEKPTNAVQHNRTERNTTPQNHFTEFPIFLLLFFIFLYFLLLLCCGLLRFSFYCSIFSLLFKVGLYYFLLHLNKNYANSRSAISIRVYKLISNIKTWFFCIFYTNVQLMYI